MGKVVGAIAMSMALAASGQAWAQEVAKITVAPDPVTGEVSVDLTGRTPGDKVYIYRDGTLVSEGTVRTVGPKTVVALPSGKAAVVHVGDVVALNPSPPAGTTVVTKETSTKVVTNDVGAPEPAPPPPPPVAIGKPVVAAPTPAPVVAAASTTVEKSTTVQLEKGETITSTHEVSTAIAQPTPRGMGVPLFPAPAVTAEMGINAPYGQGLAAAAPVGTPYLRSPAFAGPPIIYMPQTVTRVLLPGATPYPSNIMSPPANYVYASAPFIRTDIYTSLPYGTFYWPQGYAGTTPVEPQVPAYVTAPASAVMSTEADYTAARYEPGIANPETLNPITAGINANLVASTGLTSTETNGTASATVSSTAVTPDSSLTVVPDTSVTVEQPGVEASPSAETLVPAVPVAPAPVQPFPVLSEGTSVVATPAVAVSATSTSVVESAVPVVPAVPAVPVVPVAPALPELPSTNAPVPALPATPTPALPALPTDSSALPALPAGTPAASAEITMALPTLPASPASATPTPASMAPSLPTPAVPPAPATVITVDDVTPGAVTLEPADGWNPAAATDSFENSSKLATVVEGQPKKATFNASIPADGQYEVSLYWVSGTPQFRSPNVPVTINTATGPQQRTIDQTKPGNWFSLGTYQFKAGTNQPILTISTDGISPESGTVSVSVDAMRLTPQ